MSNIGLFECAEVRGVPDIWTPARIPTVLWFDAADTETLSVSAGKVSQWKDKSGNGFVATQPNDTYKPGSGVDSRCGRNVLSLGSKYMTLSTINYAASPWTLFLALDPLYSTVDNTLVFILDSLSGRLIFAHKYAHGNPRNKVSYYAGTAWSISSNATTGPQILVFNLSSPEGIIYRDGSRLSIHSYTNTAISGITTLFGACDSLGDNTMDGKMFEMVLLNYTPTQSIADYIHGYLAHKWGIAASLPPAHQYKLRPPVIESTPNYFTPMNLEGR